MCSIFNAFIYAITINQTSPNIYRKVIYLQSSNYITAMIAQPFTSTFSVNIFIPFPPPPSTRLPHHILSVHAKSLSSVSLFYSYLTNINSESLPLFVLVLVISLMLGMPVQKQIYIMKTGHVCILCLLDWALLPLVAVSFVIEISVVL